MKSRLFISSIAAFMLLTTASWGQDSPFHQGPVFKKMGQIATVEADMQIPEQAEFHVTFDVSKQSAIGKINRSFDSVARFVNMHVAAGVPRENIKVAIVVHGTASMDVTQATRYGQKRDGALNANITAIKELTENGVQIYICGQSAAYHGINKTDLLPNVKMALSAMTAHALLQQQGYTLNPF